MGNHLGDFNPTDLGSMASRSRPRSRNTTRSRSNSKEARSQSREGQVAFPPIGSIQTGPYPYDGPEHEASLHPESPNMDWLGGLDPNAAPRSGDPINQCRGGIAVGGAEIAFRPKNQVLPYDTISPDGRYIRELRRTGDTAMARYARDPESKDNKLALMKALDRTFRELRAVFICLIRNDKTSNNLLIVMAQLAPVVPHIKALKEFYWEGMNCNSDDPRLSYGCELLAEINERVVLGVHQIVPRLPYEIMNDIPSLQELYGSIRNLDSAFQDLEYESVNEDGQFPTQTVLADYPPFQWPQSLTEIRDVARRVIRELSAFRQMTEWEYSRIYQEKPTAFLLLEYCTMCNIITTSLSLPDVDKSRDGSGIGPPEKIEVHQKWVVEDGEPKRLCAICFHDIEAKQTLVRMACDEAHAYLEECFLEYSERGATRCLLCVVALDLLD